MSPISPDVRGPLIGNQLFRQVKSVLPEHNKQLPAASHFTFPFSALKKTKNCKATQRPLLPSCFNYWVLPNGSTKQLFKLCAVMRCHRLEDIDRCTKNESQRLARESGVTQWGSKVCECGFISKGAVLDLSNENLVGPLPPGHPSVSTLHSCV